MSRGLYRDGTKTGPWLEIEGRKKLTGSYGDGKRTGSWTSSIKNGTRGEMEYEDGIPHGRFEVWSPSGQKTIQGAYRNGKEHGLWTNWHENGRMGKKSEFDNGRPTGEWKQWDEEGNLLSTGKF